MSYETDDLPGTWHHLRDQERGRMLESELAHECGSNQHPMVGQRVEAVACCGTCDDVLFTLLDRQSWAIVHLTWRRETNPSWPSCDVMENWSEVIEEMADRGH
ncbi:hypothetical protein AB0J28_22620 [Streptosporangium canum]|uniref:hypothetical protein n=1 Tax=Streptosporangium canum TaxID=324952 RepID=UPI00343E4CF7